MKFLKYITFNKLQPSIDIRRSPASNVSNINRPIQQPHQHQTQLQPVAMGLPPEVFNPSGTVVKLNDEQTAKLNSELDIVDSNVQVLNEILAELEKSSDQSDKDLSLLIVALFSYNSNLINFMNYIVYLQKSKGA